MRITRISATEKAKLIIDKLRAQHGELIFHQSGGCCDGSAPMCFGRNEFLIGQRDVCLGEVHGCFKGDNQLGISFILDLGTPKLS